MFSAETCHVHASFVVFCFQANIHIAIDVHACVVVSAYVNANVRVSSDLHAIFHIYVLILTSYEVSSHVFAGVFISKQHPVVSCAVRPGLSASAHNDIAVQLQLSQPLYSITYPLHSLWAKTFSR